MTIETRFNLEDTVCFIHGRTVEFSKISAINIERNQYTGGNPKIIYTMYYMNGAAKLSEKDCFATKEELLDSL